MKRKNIRVISFFIFALAVAIGFYIRQVKISENYKETIKTGYSNSMYNLSESLNNISTDLKKSLYITTPKTFSSYAAKIYCEAEIAKESLSKLPGDNTKLETINLFLSQVGNFTLSLSKDLIAGETFTDEQKENLILLSNTADTISKAVEETKITLNNAKYWGEEVENKIKDNVDSSSLASNLTELEEKLTDYPTLIYDGPYSDHILTKKPLMLANKPEIDKNDGLNIARKLSGEKGILSFENSTQGKIECYRYSSENVTVSISKYGGYPVYMVKNREIGNGQKSAEELTKKAEAFLNSNGFPNMVLTYYESRDGLMTLNFAYLDGQTVCYTDLIKVGVAEDNGEIMSIETVGFLTNHTVRVFDAPKYTKEEALNTLSGGVSSEEAKIVLVPTPGGGEVRCYEFKCKADDNDILIYVNTQTLECQDVFILLISENGTLVK